MNNLDNTIPDQIFEQALTMHKSGKSILEISDSFPEYKAELESLFEVVSLLDSIPKTQPPTPTKTYRFAKKTSAWFKFIELLSFYRLAAVPLAFVFALVSSLAVFSAAENSLPGDSLYSLKIAGEKAKLNFTFDKEKIAQLHVELAQKRLNEAKQIIAKDDSENEQEALESLTKQTEETISTLSTLAASQAVSENNSTLLNNLVALNKEQKSLLENDSAVSETALNLSKSTDKSLAQLLATVNEQSLLNLPNKISITGTINAVINNKITLEKNTFTLNPETVITSADGELLTSTTDVKGKITVIGTRENNILVAKKVIIIDPLATIEPVTATVKPTPVPIIVTPTPEPVPEEIEVQQPSEATAGFIAEPADNQYAQ